ncbi:MAG: FeoB small GTPase domain-containing protein [Bacillota bacterium]|nr:FeoB small GTPase domain-containing protein [Bacillota bacterium]
MGLTKSSVGLNSLDTTDRILRLTDSDKVIALAGNPDVGKSNVFDYLTGLKQHTENRPGRTVVNAQGVCTLNGKNYVLVDIPGTYSLMAHSPEEEVARDFICFGGSDAVIVVCDATCLERNLNLVLQITEITDNVIVCVNLLDEAHKKNIRIDLPALSLKLGVPVIGASARSGRGLSNLMQAVQKVTDIEREYAAAMVGYSKPIEEALFILEPVVAKKTTKSHIKARWIALKLLDCDNALLEKLNAHLGFNILSDEEVTSALLSARNVLYEHGLAGEELQDRALACLVLYAEEIAMNTVCFDNAVYNVKDRKIDRILTGKYTGIFIMILMIAGIFWITLYTAHYPSNLLFKLFDLIEKMLIKFFKEITASKSLYEMITASLMAGFP